MLLCCLMRFTHRNRRGFLRPLLPSLPVTFPRLAVWCFVIWCHGGQGGGKGKGTRCWGSRGHSEGELVPEVPWPRSTVLPTELQEPKCPAQEPGSIPILGARNQCIMTKIPVCYWQPVLRESRSCSHSGGLTSKRGPSLPPSWVIQVCEIWPSVVWGPSADLRSRLLL